MATTLFTFPTGSTGIASALAMAGGTLLPLLGSMTFSVSNGVAGPLASGALRLGVFTSITALTTALNASASIVGGSILVSIVDQVFTPLSVPSCVCYIDMLSPTSFSTTTTTYTGVSSIYNMASGVAWTEGTNPPKYEPFGLSGKPCMRGDATAMRIASFDPLVVASFVGVDRDFTIMLAMQPVSASPGTFMSDFGAANSTVGTNGTTFLGRRNAPGELRLFRANDAGTTTAVSQLAGPAVVPQVVTGVSQGGKASIYVNNGVTPDPNGTSFTAGQQTPDRCGLFCYPDLNFHGFSDDRIGTALVFNTVLDDVTRRTVVAWLMSRWGIS